VSIGKAEAEIKRLAASGVRIELTTADSQPYARVGAIEAPSPPWDRDRYDVLFSIPLAFDFGTPLDGFYLALPYTFHSGEHNRVSGNTITVANRQWRLVSWHYPDGKAFNSATDSIESHIMHCRGFFLERGAVNART
jgi:hypothetical protein